MVWQSICFVLTAVLCAYGQKNEGDHCTAQNSNVRGICSPITTCKSAKNDFEKFLVSPTFCAYNPIGVSLVCCRDSVPAEIPSDTQLQDAPPVWGTSGTDTKRSRPRISEKKCEEYSKNVKVSVNYIPLLARPQLHSVVVEKCDFSGVDLIVGGEKALQGEFPHMAAIGWTNDEGGYAFHCGGSLISPKFVLTAGHCLHRTSSSNPAPVVARLGDANLDPNVNDNANPVDVRIVHLHRHPSYKPPFNYNDIGILELASDVKFRKDIRPACLWTKSDFAPYEKAIATGWGVTTTNPNDKKTSDELRKVSLSLLKTEFCDKLLKSIRNHNWQGFTDAQMCAGDLREQKDTCQGDSGAPLQVASESNHCVFHLVGVTSFGRRCAEIGRPAVYTRISAYLDWIEGIVWPGE